MYKLKKSTISNTLFLDYRNAELRIRKDWIIVYYCKNPYDESLERFRIRVPVNKSISERKKVAAKMVCKINDMLADGWTPYKQKTGKLFITLEQAKIEYSTVLQRELKDGSKRPDTVRSYESMLNMFDKYLNSKEKIKFVEAINKKVIYNYLEWIYSRGNSPISYNNYLTFTKVFCTYLLNKGYINHNPASTIPRKKKTDKIRQIIPENLKPKIAEHLQTNNFGFFVMCMCTYYSFIRVTELTKLKLSDVDLQNDVFFIDGSKSKNRISSTVTIPNELKKLLQQYLQGFEKNDSSVYLFDKNFNPGTEVLNSKKIRDTWNKYRTKLKIPDVYKFYSLKDTGITDLLLAGIPAIKVRDQARHHDIKITEMYTPRRADCDLAIKNANFRF